MRWNGDGLTTGRYVVSGEVDDERPSLQRALALARTNGARLTVAAIADEVLRGTDLEGLDLIVQALQKAVNA